MVLFTAISKRLNKEGVLASYRDLRDLNQRKRAEIWFRGAFNQKEDQSHDRISIAAHSVIGSMYVSSISAVADPVQVIN